MKEHIWPLNLILSLNNRFIAKGLHLSGKQKGSHKVVSYGKNG